MRSVRVLLDLLRHSLRVRVTLALLIPLVAILGSFTYIEQARQQATLYDNLSFLAAQTSQVMENSLRHTMLARDLEGLQHMLDAIGEDSSLRVVYLVDTQGRVAFPPGGHGVGTQLDNRDATCQPCHSLPVEQRPRSVVVTLADGQRVFRSMNPIDNEEACQGCHDPQERLIGLLLTDISMGPLEAPVAAAQRESLLWGLAIILVTVLIVNAVMSRMVIRRLEGVTRLLAGFGRGQLGVRVPVETPDEIGQVAEAFNAMSQRLQAEEAGNRALANQRQQLLTRLITVQEEERRRIARDLHDDLGQELAGLAIGLEALERTNGHEAAGPGPWLGRTPAVETDAQLRLLRQRVAAASEQVYDMIVAMRPAVLDDLGLAPAIRGLAERTLCQAGVQYTFSATGLDRRLPPEVETGLFRVIQEALNNVARHAHARHVRMELAVRAGAFEAEVADDGQGFDRQAIQPNGHTPRGMGLLGMQERVAQLNGRLEIESRPGAGTRLRIRLPLEANAGA